MLDRLAAAAGIAGEWWDVAGGRHVVGADTKRALLAAMGLAAASTAEARDAPRRARRRARAPALPAMVVAREGSPASVAIAVRRRAGIGAGALRLRHEDGTEQLLPFASTTCPRAS